MMTVAPFGICWEVPSDHAELHYASQRGLPWTEGSSPINAYLKPLFPLVITRELPKKIRTCLRQYGYLELRESCDFALLG